MSESPELMSTPDPWCQSCARAAQLGMGLLMWSCAGVSCKEQEVPFMGSWTLSPCGTLPNLSLAGMFF